MITKKHDRKFLRMFGKFLIGLLILLVILVAFGLIREAILRINYRSQYPAPGEMITIGNHDIHLNCVGKGSPTVVFEADLDQYGSLSWDPVQKEVSKLTRACSYDRAGILWSKPGPRPRDGETIAAELKTLLENAGEEGPYLLVGHGFGGAYLRIFAGKNPEDVAGMVLVESSHPDMLTRFEEITGIPQEIPDKQIRPLILLLSNLGAPGRWKGNIYNVTPEIWDPVQVYFPQSSMAWFDEKVEGPITLAQAGQYDNLGEFPLIVIASSTPISGEHGEELQEMWIDLQHDFLSLSSTSEIRELETGHYPQLQDPDLVIEAIQDVLESCK